jgi:hypothetical protein
VAAPITLVTVRGIVVATILKMAPEIFERQARDGTTFRVSDSYLRLWLYGTLQWSERKATRAAQKLPNDWEQLCERSFFHIAYGIKEEDIPPQLLVNTDQTQVVYAQGSKLTWARTGSHQVTVIGKDEKCAFTVVVSVLNSGELLPFQAIYQGYSSRSCPSESAPDYDVATAAGFRFEFSKTKTYWSTHKTMHSFVEKILVPYLSEQKAKLGLPESQKSIWQIDIWSVHRSKDFCNWMKTHHPNIILDFIPGGCTGVWQACDVGIQHIFKHSLKRSYHEDVVAAILRQIDDGISISVDRKLGALQDQSVSWMWKAHQTLNKPVIVKKVSKSRLITARFMPYHFNKAFEMCRTGNFNLSYDSLTSYEARQKLHDLETSDPEFWAQLTQKAETELTLPVDEVLAEDEENADPVFDDDSDLPCEAIINGVLGSSTRGVTSTATGNMVSTAAAESMNDGATGTSLDEEEGGNVAGLGRGKRKRTENRLYNSKLRVLKW